MNKLFEDLLLSAPIEEIVISAVSNEHIILEKADCQPCNHFNKDDDERSERWCKMWREFHKDCQVGSF